MKQIHFLFQNVPECDLLVQFCMTSVRLLCHLVDFCNTSCNILYYAHNNWKPSWSILELFSSTSGTLLCYLLHTGVFPTGRLDFVFPVPSATFSYESAWFWEASATHLDTFCPFLKPSCSTLGVPLCYWACSEIAIATPTFVQNVSGITNFHILDSFSIILLQWRPSIKYICIYSLLIITLY